MEGDGPTGAFVLLKYYQTLLTLKKKEDKCSQGYAMHPMYVKKIKKLKIYHDEALKCETLIMATLLHPLFQLRLFTQCWPEKADMAKKLLEKEFAKRVEVLKKRKEDKIQVVENKTPQVEEDDIFEMFNVPEKSKEENKELDVYINNMDHLPGISTKCPKELLLWLKDHASAYPVLASLAKDYLASSASSLEN
ncbi:uncharacterized protein PGTG_14571 [Puccinia graminis f. sp. tritici CRL 75-36-700-3]|uniref:HAT C-terminal dimerisation domain-containing protein n=1 Tax=Puccinia graminis f. sp. tritici (strain CRL 75-36-700-3 / race SCCL) TaxID=418459 RepID=E3KU81_PUCGT|nr:uncharacterized protein PGTG_14571 [Puccinia graminis f. sp. tritici CRL 75-36-700-3]EFP87856.2 hypothetical protein PGTG_14571 [Puccinia graminis f. sp. tritici CRL 75-36-700-3]